MGDQTNPPLVHRHDPPLGGGWDAALAQELAQPYWKELNKFLGEERSSHDVYPPEEDTFKAFELTPFDEVKVVILGQDPYPNCGQAHGLAFSVPADEKLPPSLRNIHKVLEADLSESSGKAMTPPGCGSLEGWAEQGVLLLNTALTVRDGTKWDRARHRKWRWEGSGWTTFTDAVIRAVNDKPCRVVFMLWGNDAKKKQALIDADRHTVITSSHPSPRSAYRGFLASRPFSSANEALKEVGTIDWARTGPST